MVPEGWSQTVPSGTLVVTLSGDNDATGLAFGSQQANASPFASNDQAQAVAGRMIQIDVLANDRDPDGAVDPASVRIVEGPRHGSLQVDSDTGQVVYQALASYSGTDSFRYDVADMQGRRSATAAVTVTVSPGSFWQNPGDRYDVNGDGFVSPIDALLIISEINRAGSREITPQTRPPSDPPPYYDVSGDGFISPRDVLLVISRINGAVQSSAPSVAMAEPAKRQNASSELALQAVAAEHGGDR